ncbi:Hypothetical predicted protein [Pelobates cultripes]|uniref:Uncharacterized protein n=1 Tax=Pelobates cultripes TaxID=61616 RepID=A0AAD1WHA8_PELCU|nr:Hypothetical predicted protein [Pelobates cultripes]
MVATRAQGGMGLPDVKGYYRAAQIAPLIAASHRSTPMTWVELEKHRTEGISLPAVAWMPPKHRPKAPEMLPTTTLTLSVWDDYRKNKGNMSPISPATPIESIQHLIPNFKHKLWHRHGILTLSQVLQGTKLKQFKDICEEFRIPTTATFSYNQLQSWINLHNSQQTVRPPDPHWLKLTEICTKTKPATKIISTIYTSEKTDTHAKHYQNRETQLPPLEVLKKPLQPMSTHPFLNHNMIHAHHTSTPNTHSSPYPPHSPSPPSLSQRLPTMPTIQIDTPKPH